LDKIAGYIQAHPTGLPGFFYAGVLLIVVGMAFKVSAFRFISGRQMYMKVPLR